eukprot:Rhum_TRINITY_DN19231_c0_g1::Rhum_TRINITY_DN19231_c0_g1_i1::g.169510::m.169510
MVASTPDSEFPKGSRQFGMNLRLLDEVKRLLQLVDNLNIENTRLQEENDHLHRAIQLCKTETLLERHQSRKVATELQNLEILTRSQYALIENLHSASLRRESPPHEGLDASTRSEDTNDFTSAGLLRIGDEAIGTDILASFDVATICEPGVMDGSLRKCLAQAGRTMAFPDPEVQEAAFVAEGLTSVHCVLQSIAQHQLNEVLRPHGFGYTSQQVECLVQVLVPKPDDIRRPLLCVNWNNPSVFGTDYADALTTLLDADICNCKELLRCIAEGCLPHELASGFGAAVQDFAAREAVMLCKAPVASGEDCLQESVRSDCSSEYVTVLDASPSSSESYLPNKMSKRVMSARSCDIEDSEWGLDLCC